METRWINVASLALVALSMGLLIAGRRRDQMWLTWAAGISVLLAVACLAAAAFMKVSTTSS